MHLSIAVAQKIGVGASDPIRIGQHRFAKHILNKGVGSLAEGRTTPNQNPLVGHDQRGFRGLDREVFEEDVAFSEGGRRIW